MSGMRVAVLGPGSIGLGSAALLAMNGHRPLLWGRSLPAGPATLEGTGAVTGRHAMETTPDIAAAIAGADAVLLTVPGFAHRAVLDAAAPHLRPGQPFVISSHASFGGLYLARRAPGVPVVAWGTTVVTGRRTGPLAVNATNIRAKVDAATLPSQWPEGVALCTALFGDRFVPRDDLVAIALSNLNPQNHLAMALCNLTRIERAEAWRNYAGVTPAVGRLMQALDAERLAIAERFGTAVRTIIDHFHLSFDVPRGSVADMAATVDARPGGPMGPTDLQSRYITEDAPFGLAATEMLGRVARVPTPLHTAGIDLLNALLGRDFRAENDLLPALGLDGLHAAALRDAVA